MTNNQIIIIGGGLAGLTAGIHLSKLGFEVTILEKNKYPKHKVCGEYISNEVLPYFENLGINVSSLNPASITNLNFSTQTGKDISINLPLGGFGVSRFALDYYLYQKAFQFGCKILYENVVNIDFEKDQFKVTTTNNLVLKSKIVIGAYGKRATLDQKLNRNFIQQKSPWLAIKAHYSGNFPNDLVGLHNFKGGYCGVSKVENDNINICYLVEYKEFSKYKNINDFQNIVMRQNPHLNEIFKNSKLLFEKPLTISQISFQPKKAVENHILMIGDTAGLIHPLCGNGMAMAIHSAKIVSELIVKYNKNDILSRKSLELEYQKKWNYNFKKRLKTGAIISRIVQKPILSALVMQFLIVFPGLITAIIKKTHGKPI